MSFSQYHHEFLKGFGLSRSSHRALRVFHVDTRVEGPIPKAGLLVSKLKYFTIARLRRNAGIAKVIQDNDDD